MIAQINNKNNNKTFQPYCLTIGSSSTPPNQQNLAHCHVIAMPWGGHIRPHQRDSDDTVEILGANIAVSAEHIASVKAME
jgi:hypothetical protein